jgi:formylglycine-generating enzyme required for sulfatase activity/purine-nucleoside phosphorylase
MPQEDFRAVIFTALAIEYKAVVAFLTDRRELILQEEIYEIGQFTASGSIWSVGIVQLGASNLSASIEAERVIAYFSPHVILFVGVAGGIKDVALGDVVVSTEVCGYEFDKTGTRSNLLQVRLGSYGMEQHVRAEAQKSDWLERLASVPSPTPKVYVAPILFGEKVVALNRSEVSQFLKSIHRKALAVEMEGYSFQILQELRRPVSAGVVRGISDLIDNRDDAQWSEPEPIRQEKAAQHASAFAFQLLANFVPDQVLTDSQVNLEQPQETYETIGILRKPHRVQRFTEPAIQLDLMLIPGGTFTMGSPPDELGRYDSEGPQHEVTISTFLLGRYPVTQTQWRAIATRTDLKVKEDLDPDPSHFKGDDRPVESVAWYEAVEFCDRLSRLTNHTYRLPTEAEWEYACRAGTKTPFHFGETITTDLANYRGEDDQHEPDKYSGHYGNGPKGEYRGTTTPVTYFHPLANSFGLCDMHGNVWEWCLDHWHDSYEGAPTDGSTWLTEDEGSRRVLRGGSWGDYPRYCRSACRRNYDPGFRYYRIGFRVICEARGL